MPVNPSSPNTPSIAEHLLTPFVSGVESKPIRPVYKITFDETLPGRASVKRNHRTQWFDGRWIVFDGRIGTTWLYFDATTVEECHAWIAERREATHAA